MTDSCATCFFSRTMTFSQPQPGGASPLVSSALACARNAPFVSNSDPIAAVGPWPMVQPDFWCGEFGLAYPTTFGLTWFSWNPVVLTGSGSFTDAAVQQAIFTQQNALIFFCFELAITTNGSAAGAIIFTLPSIEDIPNAYSAWAGTTPADYKACWAESAGGSGQCQTRAYDGTYAGGDGQIIMVQGFYKQR